MRVLQIGAGGRVGIRLARRLAAHGDMSSGIHRNPSQHDAIAAAGSVPMLADLSEMTTQQLASMMRGHAVVFSAGAHGTGVAATDAIDLDGPRKSVDAAILAGVDRFALISRFPEVGRGGVLDAGFEHYAAVKRRADAYVARQPVDWVIIRPGPMNDEPGDDRVAAGLSIPARVVRRDNVAALAHEILRRTAVSRTIVEVTDGPTSVTAAVDALEMLSRS